MDIHVILSINNGKYNGEGKISITVIMSIANGHH